MVVVVTGLFDIGRGDWLHYRRTLDQYTSYFANVLRLNMPMIVFIQPKFESLVADIRNQINQPTTIVCLDIADLYMERYRDLLFEIQRDPKYAVGHRDPNAPEITKPMYAHVTCSKPDLLRRACALTDEEELVWLDGGYSHGSINIGAITNWKPKFQKDKLKIIAVQDLRLIEPDPVEYCKKSLAVINGGYFGGHRDTIEKVVGMYYDVVDYQLHTLRLKQDDQVPWEYLVKDHPEMFEVVRAGWYDAFRV